MKSLSQLLACLINNYLRTLRAQHIRMCTRSVMFGLAVGAFWAETALAGYVGESFLQVPGIAGGWPGGQYKDWIKFEAADWPDVWQDPQDQRFCAARQCSPDETLFSPDQIRNIYRGPFAPQAGPGRLAVALDKRSSALTALMDLCQAKTTIPEVTFAESADLARFHGEVGSRPQDVPTFFEYKLQDVQLLCPVVANAPDQAFVLSFKNITLLNYDGERTRELALTLPRLFPRPANGQSRVFVVSQISSASDNSPDECPELNKGPGKKEYFALWPKDKIEQGDAELEQKGGLPVLGADIAYRGPGGLNVCALPGIVPDPGHISPQSDVARGFDLDGWDGEGEPPASTRRHKNFRSEDGRSGIDNQLYLMDGCIPGFKRNGNFTNIINQHLRKGVRSILIEISGIDDEKNDDSVAVSVFYSADQAVTNIEGVQVLPNFTFRIAEDDPELMSLFARFQGRIKDGVVTTEPLEEMTLQGGSTMVFRIFGARMRIELLPDGSMKAVLGGYQDWRPIMSHWGRSRVLEMTMGYQCPAVYNAFKRVADGLKDPLTGEFKGISVAYDLEGVRAFIPPSQIVRLFSPSSADGE